MGFFTMNIFGIRLFIILYFLLSIFLSLVVLIYFKREAIKKKYYMMRFPEKLIRVVIHYKPGLFKEYWRLIPDTKSFTFESKQYLYDDKIVIKEHDFFARHDKKEWKLSIDGHDYDLKNHLKIKQKGKKYAEIHYFHSNPNPILYDFSKKTADLSSKELQVFKDNDLFLKLLTLQDEKNMLMMLMIMVGVNMIITGFILAKIMGWLK